MIKEFLPKDDELLKKERTCEPELDQNNRLTSSVPNELFKMVYDFLKDGKRNDGLEISLMFLTGCSHLVQYF